jgi:uncharacterized protein (TIGR02466 family)
MIFNRQITPLFSIPVCIFDTDFATPEVQKIVENLHYVRNQKDDSWLCEENVLEKPELSELKSQIMGCVNEYKNDVLECLDDFVICDSWVTRHKTGDYAQMHMHQNSMFVGTFYIRTDDKAGEVTFHNVKQPALDSVEFTLQYRTRNMYNSKSGSIIPKEGQLIIFPASLPHSVSQSRSYNTRYCLAFNLFTSRLFADVSTGRIKLKIEENT